MDRVILNKDYIEIPHASLTYRVFIVSQQHCIAGLVWSLLNTVKLVYKDHLRDQQNVSLYTGGLYMQVQQH